MFMKPSRLLNLDLRTSFYVVFKVYFWAELNSTVTLSSSVET